MFAPRSLALYRVRFNARGDAGKIEDPANLGGKDVLELLSDFWN